MQLAYTNTHTGMPQADREIKGVWNRLQVRHFLANLQRPSFVVQHVLPQKPNTTHAYPKYTYKMLYPGFIKALLNSTTWLNILLRLSYTTWLSSKGRKTTITTRKKIHPHDKATFVSFSLSLSRRHLPSSVFHWLVPTPPPEASIVLSGILSHPLPRSWHVQSNKSL